MGIQYFKKILLLTVLITSLTFIQSGNGFFHFLTNDQNQPSLQIGTVGEIPTVSRVSYFGGISEDRITAIATDNQGNLVVAGMTNSETFLPVEDYIGSREGFDDSFVAKFDSTGAIVFFTFLGGGWKETLTDIAIDSDGSIVVVGETNSQDFPVTEGVIQENYTIDDAFVTILDPSGNIQISTFFGGTGFETNIGLAIDESRNIYISGTTSSSDLGTTDNAYQTSLGGLTDVFFAKFDAQLKTLLYCTYLGANNTEVTSTSGDSIALDTAGNIVITGSTRSPLFPLIGSIQSNYSGNQDAFVAEFNVGGDLTFTTLIGGENIETGHGVVIDSNNSIIVTGMSNSTYFPFINTGWDFLRGGDNIFVNKINSARDEILVSTFLCGRFQDVITDLIIDSDENIILVGYTRSLEFPMIRPIQESLTGESDAFLAIISSDCQDILFSTYYGGVNFENDISVAVDINGRYIVAGSTNSIDLQTKGAIQSFKADNLYGYDGFIVFIEFNEQIPGTGLSVVQFIGVIITITGSAVLILLITKIALDRRST